MNYIIEAVLVGFYTCLVYLLFSPFIKNFYILLLVVGFSKHFLGSSIGLHTWYCNNGEACLKVLKPISKSYNANTLYLIRDSIYESFLFLFLGYVLSYKLTKSYLYFTIGMMLHMFAENVMIHKTFCKKTCDKI
jgi:hypothetical protein